MKQKRTQSKAEKKYIRVFAHFISFQEVVPRSNTVRTSNMIFNAPAPIRHLQQIRNIEGMLAELAERRLAEEKSGPRIIGEKVGVQVSILNVTPLDIYEQELTEEDLARIAQKNEEARKAKGLQDSATAVMEELAGTPIKKQGDAN